MENPSAPVVETRRGALIGFTEGDTHVWCGIPYAAPPVGPWRWRSPRPPCTLGWRASGDGVLRLQLAEQRKLPGSWAAATPASSLKTACILTSGRQWLAPLRFR